MLSNMYARKLEGRLDFSTLEYPKRLAQIETIKRNIESKKKLLSKLYVEISHMEETLKDLMSESVGSDGL